MTHRNVLRAAVIATTLAVSCNVYDPALLVGSGGAGDVGIAGAGIAGSGDSGNAGSAGAPQANGGNAGLADTGGLPSAGGEAGTGEGGTVLVDFGGGAGTAGALAGSAGMRATAGSSGSLGNGGTSGTGGAAGAITSGAAGSAGHSGSGGAGGSGGSSGSAAGGKSGAGGSAGSAGSTGAAGSAAAGASGTAGSAGSGGSAGSAGASGTAGTAGGGVTANGCANLSVPLLANTHKARFVITLANTMNFGSATISMRVYVKAGTGGVIANYVQDSAFNLLKNSTPASLGGLSGWQTLTWNVAAQGAGTTGIALSGVLRVGIEINAAPDTSWSNPTLVYVDSLIVSSPALSFNFDTSATVSTAPSIQDVAGQALWQNAYSADTTASNVTLGWLASCP